jgi:hypothetical protein
MSFAFVQDIAATWHQYERFASAIAARPEGLVLHVAGPTDDGVRIIGVWESESAWERFKAEFELERGQPGPPPPTTFRALRPKHVVVGRLATKLQRHR